MSELAPHSMRTAQASNCISSASSALRRFATARSARSTVCHSSSPAVSPPPHVSLATIAPSLSMRSSSVNEPFYHALFRSQDSHSQATIAPRPRFFASCARSFITTALVQPRRKFADGSTIAPRGVDRTRQAISQKNLEQTHQPTRAR